MTTETQCSAILAHLKCGLSVTPLDALRKFQCMRLAARIGDLERKGHRIDRVWERHGGKRYKRYFLAKGKRK